MKSGLKSSKTKFWIQLTLSILASVFILVSAVFYIAVFVLTPENIRNPQPEHLHFRMQLVIEGETVNFAEDRFQEPLSPGSCSFSVTEDPIHFHDGKDQIVHVHWKNLTGGQVLKNFGINLIDKSITNSTLGFAFEKKSQVLPTNKTIWGRMFGNLDSRISSGELKLYVYSGEKDNYSSKDSKEFLTKSLEDFFGKKSIVAAGELPTEFKLSNLWSLNAEAHGVTIPSKSTTLAAENNTSSSSSKVDFTEEELKEINNLIGNVVIFIQKDAPTDAQIKAKFDNLIPLEPSVCGG